jgi:hypothetical protein
MRPVCGSEGEVLTVANLPKPVGARWVARRKAAVVASVQGGLLGLAEACDRYAISKDEFIEWEHSYAVFGIFGLKALRKRKHNVRAQ